MDDLYDVWRERIDKPGVRGHVWLRTVALAARAPSPKDKKPIAHQKDPLSERQQQIRVFTELVTGTQTACVNRWLEILGDIENDANYFRFVGRVRKPAFWSCEKKNQPLIPIGADREPMGTIVVLGAYPEFDTYFNVREGILENGDAFASAFPLSHATTHLLWEPRQQADKVLWPRASSGEWFFVLLAAPFPNDVLTDPRRLSHSSWHKMITGLNISGFNHWDHGIVMGEWNFYAIYRSASDLKSEPDWDAIANTCKQRLREMRRLRFYGCIAETTHATRKCSPTVPAAV